MTRHDSLFVPDFMKMSPNEHRHVDVRSVYKTLTRTTGPRTHPRRPHYLMAPTYVFAVSRSLREQSDTPETDRLPTTSPPTLRHPHFRSFLFLFPSSWLILVLSSQGFQVSISFCPGEIFEYRYLNTYLRIGEVVLSENVRQVSKSWAFISVPIGGSFS